MKVYIRSNRNGDVTIHKKHRPDCKGLTVTQFENRNGEQVFEYNGPTGLVCSFIEVELLE